MTERDRELAQDWLAKNALMAHGWMLDDLAQLLSRVRSETGWVSGPIVIHKSPTADTRSCDFANVSKQTLYDSSVQHIADVAQGLAFFGAKLREAAARHDFDKLSDIDHFHADFVTGFKQTGWWDKHRKINRHHLLQADGVPADVNLIDVLDMVADCVMAGMARTGEVYALNISPDVLMAAFQNTVTLLKANVMVAAPPSRCRRGATPD